MDRFQKKMNRPIVKLIRIKLNRFLIRIVYALQPFLYNSIQKSAGRTSNQFAKCSNRKPIVKQLHGCSKCH